jgi:hypothetical protein
MVGGGGDGVKEAGGGTDGSELGSADWAGSASTEGNGGWG